MSFLDCNGALVPYSYEAWKDEGKRDSEKVYKVGENLKFTTFLISPPSETPTKGTNRMSPTLNQDSAFGDRQFMVITSEKQCRIVALPSQNCVYRLQITETDFVVRAEIVSMKGLSKWKLVEGISFCITKAFQITDSVCLVCYVSNGHLMAFSLPSLRLLLDVDFLPLADLR